ncbi:MAG: NADH-quinone oxidoreductase subunit M [Candidatus Bathyarchaeota archaeon]|nr:NADH-quinone oxidoreductase subunit M [Candidatus Bathyarchaeota archaeon]
MAFSLLLVFLLPILSLPFVYFAGKKSSKAAGTLVGLVALANIGLVLSAVPEVINNTVYTESYTWISVLNSHFSLFLDGISASIAIITLVLIVAAAFFSIRYMDGKKNLPVYYCLLSLLSVGLVGVFITSNFLLFYFCWELMLVPAYFIIGGWGYRDSYKAAFKLFIFTHAGAVFVLLGIGAIYITTGQSDMFAAQTALLNPAYSEIAKWILLALTAGFAVKMAVVPVHMWLPDAHSEAPATMSALLSGVIISAGAYAILRLSLVTVLPAVTLNDLAFATSFLHGLAIFGVISAFFGAFIALVETDIKRIIAYSSIAHMGYVMFGLSLFPSAIALALAQSSASAGGLATAQAALTLTAIVAASVAVLGTVLHILTHAVSKGLLFLSAGSVMHQTEERDIRKMGGLASKMPFTGVSSVIAALSIAGSPPFACFWSELFIFVGAFEIIKHDGFYTLPTVFMLIATVLSLAYSLRFVNKVFLGKSKPESAEESEPEPKKKIWDVPHSMKLAMAILVVFIVVLGTYPAFFINLIKAVALI